MTDRKPTDAQILRGFKDFEKGFNVWRQWERTNTPPNTIKGETEETDRLLKMWKAHTVYRELAIAAQERIDARKKEGK